MNKTYIICLSCGKVQVRTDILEDLNNKYIILSKRIMCPSCGRETKQIATKNIKTLNEKIDENNKRDIQILNLIKR